MGVEGEQEMNTVFCYDSMNRLTMENRREGGEKYAYDLNGNRLRKQRYHYALNATGNMDSVIDGEESYCYNERNELTERRSLSAVTAYLYDENGSLIKEKEGEKETGYRYDLLNRQTYVHLPDGREQENLYDGEGLRAGLTENGKSTTFLFYNGEILAECSGDSMPVRRHLRGIGLSGVEDISTGTSHIYHQDEQGSTAYVTGSNGETENLYSYDGFGNLIESREDITNRILYTGQQYDQETGQYYLRARYYNPVIGRFTQEDTYRGDGLNLYAYCGNNPVMYYDPNGYAQGSCDKDANKKPDSTPTEGTRADFYVTPDGDVVPSTAYRYMSSDKASDALNTGSQYATYIGFDKYDSAAQAQNAFQVSPEWSDCKVRGSFDTLQVIDDMYVPTTLGNTTMTPEPFATSYPKFGDGGAQQFRVDKVIDFLEVEIIGD